MPPRNARPRLIVTVTVCGVLPLMKGEALSPVTRNWPGRDLAFVNW